MKKTFLFFTFLTACVSVTLAQDLIGGMIPASKLPSCTDFIASHPYPTKDTDLEAWEKDSVLYFQLKEAKYDTVQKGADIIVQKNWDSIWAHLNEQYYFALHRLAADSVMNAPFITINWKESSKITLWDEEQGKDTTYYTAVSSHPGNTETFPNMIALEKLCETMKDENLPSSARTRPRPYNYFPNQYYNGALKPHNPNATGSYPSGHGYFKGLFGKCMEIVDPEHNEAIQNMLEEWLLCRLQKGAHWYSDLPAGEELGKMAFDSAMTVEAFRDLVDATKLELKNYRDAQNPSPPTGILYPGSAEKAYKRLENGRVLIIRNGAIYTVHGQVIK